MSKLAAAQQFLPATSAAVETSEPLAVPRHATLAGFTQEVTERHGLHLQSLTPLTHIRMITQNTRYSITVIDPGEWTVLVQGGRFFPQSRRAFLCGSGYGGSLLKTAWIGVGLCCELTSDEQRIITSPVVSFEIEPDEDLAGPF